MNQPKYLKRPCLSCGESIEFPSDGVGQTITCPHCGQATALSNAPSAETLTEVEVETSPQKPKGKFSWLVVIAIVIAAGGAAGFILKTRSSNRAPEDSSDGTKTIEHSATTNTIPAAATGVRSIDDLRVGTITLEKAKGSSLVYAVGVLRNNSDLQRFGVTIELALSDARGNPAGTAKDYRSVIEPRQEWSYRALVLDSKAVSARISEIREEE